MKLAICYNLKKGKALKAHGNWHDADAEYEDRETIDALVNALEAYSGNPVVRLPCDRDLAKRLESENMDLVFNIAEGWGGRNREAYAPSLFEIYGIPYTGSDGLALSLTLDKALAKKVLQAEGLPTPEYFVVRDLPELEGRTLPFPLFVKPCHEGTSKGIRNFSKVNNRQELRRVVAWVLENYRQPALVERFINGPEWAVSILGNGPDCNILPLAEIRFTPENPFYSFECKTLVDEEVRCPGAADRTLRERMEQISLTAYRVFGCRDLARLDLRIDETGEPYIIEVNPLPGLSTKYSLFPIQAAAAGLEYKQMVRTIVETAMKRNDMKKEKPGLAASHGKNRNRLWKDQIKNRVRDVEALTEFLHLDRSSLEEFNKVQAKIPFAITPYLLSLADPKDPACPIRRQFLPSSRELEDPYGQSDPLLEQDHAIAPGLIQVYADRAAWTMTSFCPSLCRHCLRRDRFQSSQEEGLTMETIGAVLQAVSNNTNIRDILLTGGDPLTYEDDFLEDLLGKVRRIDHIQIIRLGTRVPTTLPQRITPNLLRMLGQFHPLWISTQFNHPREITEQSADACIRIADAGIPLLNQSVLLKGVNDAYPVMKELVEGLVRIRVRPYYLYQCQLIQGTAHFRTSVEEGMGLIKNLRGRTSGFAIPLFILDTPYGKVPLNPGYYKGRDNGSVMMASFDGRLWEEPNPVFPEQ